MRTEFYPSHQGGVNKNVVLRPYLPDYPNFKRFCSSDFDSFLSSANYRLPLVQMRLIFFAYYQTQCDHQFECESLFILFLDLWYI